MGFARSKLSATPIPPFCSQKGGGTVLEYVNFSNKWISGDEFFVKIWFGRNGGWSLLKVLAVGGPRESHSIIIVYKPIEIY